MIERSNPLSAVSGRASFEIPGWLQEFREILVDDEIPEHRHSHASYSHEASLEPIFKRREDLGKHSVYTHFPKDRNCKDNTSNDPLSPCKCAIIWLQMKLTITEYSLTTARTAISRRKELYTKYRVCVVKTHNTNDNVTTKTRAPSTQST